MAARALADLVSLGHSGLPQRPGVAGAEDAPGGDGLATTGQLLHRHRRSPEGTALDGSIPGPAVGPLAASLGATSHALVVVAGGKQAIRLLLDGTASRVRHRCDVPGCQIAGWGLSHDVAARHGELSQSPGAALFGTALPHPGRV